MQSCTNVQITSTIGNNVFDGLDAVPPVISGDGTHIAFVSSADIVNNENPDLNQELFLYDGTTQTTNQITHTTARDFLHHQFSITIDGGKIAFSSTLNINDENTNQAQQIFVYDAASSNITQITHITNALDFAAAPLINSYDGTRISFISTDDLVPGSNPSHRNQLFLYDDTTKSFRQLTFEDRPFLTSIVQAISGDGTRIAFTAQFDPVGQNSSHELQIFLFDTITNAYTQLTRSLIEFPDGSDAQFRISADGSKVAAEFKYDPNTGAHSSNPRIYVYSIADQTWTQAVPDDPAPRLSRWLSLNYDGTRIAFSNRYLIEALPDYVEEVQIYDTVAAAFTQVTTPQRPYQSHRPSISANGARIAFVSDADLIPGQNLDHNHEVFLATCPASRTFKFDFHASASPAFLGLTPSSTRTTELTLRSVNGVTDMVQLSAAWSGTAPAGVTFTFSPTNQNVPSIGPVSAILSISAAASPSLGRFTLTITGTSASGVTKSIDLPIVIASSFDFTASASPASLPLIASSTKTSQITLKSANGVNDTVQLSGAWSGTAPAGVTFTITPTNLAVPSIGPVTATLTVSASASPSPGTFTLTITGTSSGGVTSSVNLSIVVAGNLDFTASASPSSLSLIASSTKTSQITLRSVNGVSDSVQMSMAWSGPPGVMFTLAPTGLTVPSTGGISATLTVSTPASPPSGTFTLTITATSAGGVTKTLDLPILIANNLSAPSCGCTKTGPFEDPRVEGLHPSSTLATVSVSSGLLTLKRNSDGKKIVTDANNVSAFGFSSNGKFFVLITQPSPASFYLDLYSVSAGVRVGAGSPLVINPTSWGFSPDDNNSFFVVTSSTALNSYVDVTIYSSTTGNVVMSDSITDFSSFGPPPWTDEQDVDDNDSADNATNDNNQVGGWGFSPDGNTFVISYKTDPATYFIILWTLTRNNAAVTPGEYWHDVASFWQFSPCGDLFMFVHQAGANPTNTDIVDFLFTSNGHQYREVHLDPTNGAPSASVAPAPGTNQVQLTGMDVATIPSPQCWASVTAFSPVNISLTDGLARQTGFDPVTGGTVNHIPGGSYTGVGSEPQTVTVPYLAGTYIIDAFGLDSLTSPQPYTLRIATADASGELFSQVDLQAMASRGSDGRFPFTIGNNSVVMPPLIVNVKLVGGTNINFSLQSVTGLTYVIEFKTALNDTNWVTLRTQTGNGGSFNILDNVTPAASRFYRIRVE